MNIHSPTFPYLSLLKLQVKHIKIAFWMQCTNWITETFKWFINECICSAPEREREREFIKYWSKSYSLNGKMSSHLIFASIFGRFDIQSICWHYEIGPNKIEAQFQTFEIIRSMAMFKSYQNFKQLSHSFSCLFSSLNDFFLRVRLKIRIANRKV